MEEIVTERAGSILRVQLNRPAKLSAMTSTVNVASRANQGAMKAENDEFSGLVRSEEAKWAFRAFLEKRKIDFASIAESSAARKN